MLSETGTAGTVAALQPMCCCFFGSHWWQVIGRSIPRCHICSSRTVGQLRYDAEVLVTACWLSAAGASTMLAHVVACNPDPACKQNALRILQDLATSAPPSPKTTSTAGADLSDLLAQQAQTEDYTADSVIDRLVRRGLPVVLLKLLHAAPQTSLQARAMKLLQLLAAARQEVLVSIKELVEYEIVPGQEKQQVSYTGIQVLQGLMRSSSSTVQGGAVEVLQALADAGLIGRGAKQGK